MPPLNGTYKVIGINYRDIDHLGKMEFQVRKEIARQVASLIPGEANLDDPEVVLQLPRLKENGFSGTIRKIKAFG